MSSRTIIDYHALFDRGLTAGQRTLSGLIGALTGQTSVSPVVLDKLVGYIHSDPFKTLEKE